MLMVEMWYSSFGFWISWPESVEKKKKRVAEKKTDEMMMKQI